MLSTITSNEEIKTRYKELKHNEQIIFKDSIANVSEQKRQRGYRIL